MGLDEGHRSRRRGGLPDQRSGLGPAVGQQCLELDIVGKRQGSVEVQHAAVAVQPELSLPRPLEATGHIVHVAHQKRGQVDQLDPWQAPAVDLCRPQDRAGEGLAHGHLLLHRAGRGTVAEIRLLDEQSSP